MTHSTHVREQVTLRCGQERPVKEALEHSTTASLSLTERMTFLRLRAMDHVQQIEKIKAHLGYSEA